MGAAPALILLAFVLASTASVLPIPASSNGSLDNGRCGPVSQFYGATAKEWQDSKTDEWLNSWFQSHDSHIKAHKHRFAGAFGEWALGDPNFSCRDAGSTSSCDFQACNNPVLNNLNPNDLRPAYYVLQSLRGIHTYFTGLREASEVGAIGSAFSKESWTKMFYSFEDNDERTRILKHVLSGVSSLTGVVAAFAALASPAAAIAGGVLSSIAQGAFFAGTIELQNKKDDTFDKNAEVGVVLTSAVLGSIKRFTQANNDLVGGSTCAKVDIRAYFSGGAFVNFADVNKNAVTDAMNALFLGKTVNSLWRQQRVFILGGGRCGDDQGIGWGPQGAQSSVCRDGRAWYIYYWHAGKTFAIPISKKWGWVTAPPGADQLGQGDLAGVTVADVINSSLDAYMAAGYAYDEAKAVERIGTALQTGSASPGAQGAAWEGTFTIPVCDVSGAISQDWKGKGYILKTYHREDSIPEWCGPICSNDMDKTRQFIKAANMKGFKSPRRKCKDVGY